MARPTDPAKLARQARNSAAYRARQRAERSGAQPPPEAKLQRPAIYRPPSVRGIVEHAQAVAKAQREARAEIISQLPDIRNPRVFLRPPEQTARAAPERKTRAGKRRQAQVIRERAAAERIQAIGRTRKTQLVNELRFGQVADRLQETMTADQQRDFQRYSEIIAEGSQQSIGILFEYAGGQNQYSAALERILASPESRDVEEGLSMLASLARQARQAAVMYSPSNIGRITV